MNKYDEDVHEGLTEFFTQQITGTRDQYSRETQIARELVRRVGEGTVRDAYFRVDKHAIEQVQNALEGRWQWRQGFLGIPYLEKEPTLAHRKS